MLYQVFLLCALPFLASSFILAQRKWDGLKVTWDVNPLSARAFASLPRTEAEAKREGFHQISDCDESSHFRGRRYVKGNDYAVVLLYDANGYIAGIQGGMDKHLPNGYPFRELQPPFLADGNHFFITAYFVDPSMICRGGRSAHMFGQDGTGTNLYIQNGTDPVRDSLLIPKLQSGVDKTMWTKGKCFPSMGVHYWYDIRQDMSCHDFFPAFLLYNAGRLTAFGWAFGTDLSSSRFEHPPQGTFGMFMQTVPTCLTQMGTLTTLHIYLTDHPALNTC